MKKPLQLLQTQQSRSSINFSEPNELSFQILNDLEDSALITSKGQDFEFPVENVLSHPSFNAQKYHFPTIWAELNKNSSDLIDYDCKPPFQEQNSTHINSSCYQNRIINSIVSTGSCYPFIQTNHNFLPNQIIQSCSDYVGNLQIQHPSDHFVHSPFQEFQNSNFQENQNRQNCPHLVPVSNSYVQGESSSMIKFQKQDNQITPEPILQENQIPRSSNVQVQTSEIINQHIQMESPNSNIQPNRISNYSLVENIENLSTISQEQLSQVDPNQNSKGILSHENNHHTQLALKDLQ